MVNYRKSIRVTYNIKNEDGFVIEKYRDLPSLKDAFTFIALLMQGGKVVGKPILENK